MGGCCVHNAILDAVAANQEEEEKSQDEVEFVTLNPVNLGLRGKEIPFNVGQWFIHGWYHVKRPTRP